MSRTLKDLDRDVYARRAHVIVRREQARQQSFGFVRGVPRLRKLPRTDLERMELQA